MVLNADKCHYMCPGKDTVNNMLKSCDEELEARKLETVLGIEIVHNLNFEDHIKTLFNKVTKKLNALPRIVNFINCCNRNHFFQSTIKPQFSYCPLVWIVSSRSSNNFRSSKTALKVKYNNKFSSFTQLLRIKDDSTIHQQNIQTLVKEVYKFKKNLSPNIVSNLFQVLENFQQLANFKMNTVMNSPTFSIFKK